MKISIIGAGNVGGTAALRIAESLPVEVTLVDVAKGFAQGKAFDLEDARSILKNNYNITGSDDITVIKDSSVVVITAGLARKPGMTREELRDKNAQILKEISLKIKTLAPKAIVIVVTNPLDLMTYLVFKTTGFPKNRVLGMGVGLDASRFANLIAKELNLSVNDINPVVVGAHGEGMLPLALHTKVKGVSLDEFVDEVKMRSLVDRTVKRGAEIVSLLGSGSAYFAPSAAITEIVRAIVKDEKRVIGVSAYLEGEYGVDKICIGVPARIGKDGIEGVLELELNKEEKVLFLKASESIRNNLEPICNMI